MDDYQQKMLEEDPDLHWAINNTILAMLAPLGLALIGLTKVCMMLGGEDSCGIVPTGDTHISDRD